MDDSDFMRKQYHSKTREMMRYFAETGEPPKAIARKFGISYRRAEWACYRAPAVKDIGEAPQECRLGVFSGYKAIIEPILKKYGVTWAQAIGAGSTRRIVRCRWETWTALNDAGKKLAHIGWFFNRHHTTVLNGVRRFREGATPYHMGTKQQGRIHVRPQEADNCGQATQRGQEGSGESSRAA